MRFTPRRSSPRLHSFTYQGSYAYHLVLRTRAGLPRFDHGRLVAFCLERLAASASRFGFDLVAYCFMPTHVHLLVAGGHDAPLVRFVQHFKQATGHHSPGLWQRSYYDHILRREEAVEDVARYIWANPVRAGMVDSMTEYPYAGPHELLVAHEQGTLRVEGGKDEEDRAKALSLRPAEGRALPGGGLQ